MAVMGEAVFLLMATFHPGDPYKIIQSCQYISAEQCHAAKAVAFDAYPYLLDSKYEIDQMLAAVRKGKK